MLKERIKATHTHCLNNVYGIRNNYAELTTAFDPVARSTAERLCNELEIHSVVKEKFLQTTKPSHETKRPADLAIRDFNTAGPNRLWVRI